MPFFFESAFGMRHACSAYGFKVCKFVLVTVHKFPIKYQNPNRKHQSRCVQSVASTRCINMCLKDTEIADEIVNSIRIDN
jgi:hypothetical protein